MDLFSLQSQLNDIDTSAKLPPVDKWDPPFCGDMPLVIKSNGQWWHAGTPFTRAKLVKLFASVLKKEADDYFLVTPVEKIRIQVEDVPFVIIDSTINSDKITVTTQVGDHFSLGSMHPIELRNFQESCVPYVKVRRNLWARIHQNVLYRWIDQAKTESDGKMNRLYLLTEKEKFCIGEYSD